jgi:hypothetical protein
MAVDMISGHIQRLLDSVEFKQTAHAADRDSRRAALDRTKAVAEPSGETEEKAHRAAQGLWCFSKMVPEGRRRLSRRLSS